MPSWSPLDVESAFYPPILNFMGGIENTLHDFAYITISASFRIWRARWGLCMPKPSPDALGARDGGRCEEIINYVGKLERVNFARSIVHDVAQHGQFPSNLPSLEDGFNRVSELMQKILGKKASDVFEARDGADDFGTGRSINMFTAEHVFLEFPGLMLTELKEKPAIYGCKLES
jgi:hypothetical protein